MGKSILDEDLRRWEPFATTADGGLPAPGRIVFRCTSDPAVRPRVVTVEGDKSLAEQTLAQGSGEELEALFREAVELS